MKEYITNKYVIASTTAAIAILLLASLAIAYTPASPVETSAGAAVGVNEYISFTVTDYGAAGTAFGDLNPGTTDQAATDAPAVNLAVAKETNVDLNISLKGDDFVSGANTLAVTNVKYDDDATLGESTETGLAESTLSTTYALWWALPNPTVDESEDVYYWISIPTEQTAGDYTSTFYFEAKKA